MENHPQLFFEQVGAIQRSIEPGDHGQLGGLVRRQILGLSEQPPTAGLQLSGLRWLTRATRLVPDRSTHLVQRIGRPADHMKRVQADGGVGAVLLGRAPDPLGALAGGVAELSAALWAEVLEEALPPFLAPTFGRPDQPTSDVINHQRQVALPSTPTDLVDTD